MTHIKPTMLSLLATLGLASTAHAGSGHVTAGIADPGAAAPPSRAPSGGYVDVSPDYFTMNGVDPYFELGQNVSDCFQCGQFIVTAGGAIVQPEIGVPKLVYDLMPDPSAPIRSCLSCYDAAADAMSRIFRGEGTSVDLPTPLVPFPDVESTDDYPYQVDTGMIPDDDE